MYSSWLLTVLSRACAPTYVSHGSGLQCTAADVQVPTEMLHMCAMHAPISCQVTLHVVPDWHTC